MSNPVKWGPTARAQTHTLFTCGPRTALEWDRGWCLGSCSGPCRAHSQGSVPGDAQGLTWAVSYSPGVSRRASRETESSGPLESQRGVSLPEGGDTRSQKRRREPAASPPCRPRKGLS